MKLITCVIRPDRLPAVKEALFRGGVTGMTLGRASGHGGEHDRAAHTHGMVVIQFGDKVKIEMVCSEPYVNVTVDAIVRGARTGAEGDGKIFVQTIDRVIRIRTGEENNAALTPVTADEVRRRALDPVHVQS
ncbi:MAG TPA: P-II family nitrogen regulator [Gemmatimonadaceae bacterium]|jgi:nitrogen regulatory protein P-II 1|nr:P-II family nitrogen regulator [Gemmatimonadaceae bacterium]